MLLGFRISCSTHIRVEVVELIFQIPFLPLKWRDCHYPAFWIFHFFLPKLGVSNPCTFLPKLVSLNTFLDDFVHPVNSAFWADLFLHSPLLFWSFIDTYPFQKLLMLIFRVLLCFPGSHSYLRLSIGHFSSPWSIQNWINLYSGLGWFSGRVVRILFLKAF